MEGVILRGRLVSVELPESADANGRWGFGNVTLQAAKPDGEPYWIRAAFNVVRRDETTTAIADALVAMELNTLVELAAEANVSRRSNALWWKAFRAEAVAEDVPASSNGKGRRQSAHVA